MTGMIGDVESGASHGEDGGLGGGHASAGEGAGAEDVDFVAREVLEAAIEFLSDYFSSEGLGHRGTAGISATDEEDREGGEFFESAAVDDAFAEDFIGVVGDFNDGGGLLVAGGAAIEDEIDPIAEILFDLRGIGSGGQVGGVGGGGRRWVYQRR